METLPFELIEDIYNRSDINLSQNLLLSKRAQIYKEQVYKMICDNWISYEEFNKYLENYVTVGYYNFENKEDRLIYSFIINPNTHDEGDDKVEFRIIISNNTYRSNIYHQTHDEREPEYDYYEEEYIDRSYHYYIDNPDQYLNLDLLTVYRIFNDRIGCREYNKDYAITMVNEYLDDLIYRFQSVEYLLYVFLYINLKVMNLPNKYPSPKFFNDPNEKNYEDYDYSTDKYKQYIEPMLETVRAYIEMIDKFNF